MSSVTENTPIFGRILVPWLEGEIQNENGEDLTNRRKKI